MEREEIVAFEEPFEFTHKPLEWIIQLDYKMNEIEMGEYKLKVNGVSYEEMAEAPPRERADLARSAITMNMNGPKK